MTAAYGNEDNPSEYLWTCPNCEGRTLQEFGRPVYCSLCNWGWCEGCLSFSGDDVGYHSDTWFNTGQLCGPCSVAKAGPGPGPEF